MAIIFRAMESGRDLRLSKKSHSQFGKTLGRSVLKGGKILFNFCRLILSVSLCRASFSP